MTTQRIFKIKDSVHEEFWIIEKEDRGISLKRYIYGVLSHKDFLDFWVLKRLEIAYQSFTLESIVKLSNPVKVYNSTKATKIAGFEKSYETNERRWDNFMQNLEKVLSENEEVTEIACYFDELGIVEKEGGDYIGKRIIKGFDSIMKIYISDCDGIDLIAKNQLLKKVIENYRKNRETILENLKASYDEIKRNYEEFFPGDTETCPFINDIFEYEQYLIFESISLWSTGAILRVDVFWDEEHGVELEFDNNGKFIFQ